MIRPLLAAFGMMWLLVWINTAEAQVFIKAPFVRIYDGGPNGPVYIKAPLVTVDVPASDPAMVAAASEYRIRLIRGIWCIASNKPACFPTATSVPTLSNRSTNKNTNTISAAP